MRKLWLFISLLALSVALIGCDFLSTINAIKGLKEEYDTYSQLYQNAQYLEFASETEFIVVETNITGLESISFELDMKFDIASGVTYLKQITDEFTRESVIESIEGIQYEYVIEDNVVTTTFSSENSDVILDREILNFDEGFSFSDIDNERKTETHTYELDIALDKVINLEKIAEVVNRLNLFETEAETFPNAIAHLTVAFANTNSQIDMQVRLDDYRLEFTEGAYAVFSVTNHTVTEIPETNTIPDVFSETYLHNPAEEVGLARKINYAGDAIQVPYNNGIAGWIQVKLEPGSYVIFANQMSKIYESYLVDSSGQDVAYVENETVIVTISEAGSYFMYIKGNSSYLLEVTFSSINN